MNNRSDTNVTEAAGYQSDFNAIAKITVWTSMFLPAFFVGFCGLLLLFCTIVTSRRKRHGAGVIILHFTLVQMAIITTQAAWLLDTFFSWKGLPTIVNCKSVVMALTFLIYTEAWLQFLLAFNRVIAIVYPVLYPKVIQSRALILEMGLCWCVALSCEVPVGFGIGGYFAKLPVINTCFSVPYPGVAYSLMTGVGGVVPIMATGVVYSVIYRHLNRPSRRVEDPSTQSLPQARWQRKRKMTVILFWTFISYLCLFCPSMLMYAFEDSIAVNVNGSLVMLSAIAFESVTYGLSPVFFFTMSQDYRNGALRLLRLRSRRSDVNEQANRPSRKHLGSLSLPPGDTYALETAAAR